MSVMMTSTPSSSGRPKADTVSEDPAGWFRLLSASHVLS